MPLDLVCNFRKCRRSLSNQAWVTTCSHAFCIEHGKTEFRRNADHSLICPACGTELRDKFDIIQADLHPSETFKTIVLAGMKPDTIMDVAMRAMSFWSYQVEQETMYQESLAKHLREKLGCLEEIHSLNTQKIKAELDTYKRKIQALQLEYNKKRKQTEELAVSVEEKSRKIQKLTIQLESQKRKGIHEGFERPSVNQGDRMDMSSLMEKRKVPDSFVFKPVKDPSLLTVNSLVSPPKTPMFDFRQKKNHQESHFQFRPFSP